MLDRVRSEILLVVRVTLWSLLELIDKRHQIFRAIVFPFIIVVVLELLEFDAKLNFVTNFFLALMYAVAAIGVHRVILGINDGLNQINKRSIYRLIKYLSYSLITGIIFSIIGFGLTFSFESVFHSSEFGSLFLISFFGFGFYVLSRLSLIFPAIAVDNSFTLTDSWRISKKNKFLTFAVVVIPILFAVLTYFLLPNYEWIKPITEILNIFVTMLFVSLLTNCYKFLVLGSDNNSNL